DRDLVTITRNDEQRVKVRLEDCTRAGAPGAERDAFVVLNGTGETGRKFDTLASAVMAAGSGDIGEIRGNGPFVTPPIAIGGGVRVIRAGTGYRSIIHFVREEPDARVLISSDASLILEGLDIRSGPPGPKQSPIAILAGPSLRAANCRFQLPDFFAIWA